jgi:hypothetical protein
MVVVVGLPEMINLASVPVLSAGGCKFVSCVKFKQLSLDLYVITEEARC